MIFHSKIWDQHPNFQWNTPNTGYMTVKSNLCCTEGILGPFKDQESFREEISLEQRSLPLRSREWGLNHPELNSISPEKVKKRQRTIPADQKRVSRLGSACLQGVSHQKSRPFPRESKLGVVWTPSDKKRLYLMMKFNHKNKQKRIGMAKSSPRSEGRTSPGRKY